MARKTSKPARKTSRALNQNADKPKPKAKIWMPLLPPEMLEAEATLEEQRPLYVGKEAGQEAQRAFRAQAAEQAARVAAIRAAEPADVFIQPRTKEDLLSARERMPSAFLPVPTERATTWADRRAVDSFLMDQGYAAPEDPELLREWREFIDSPIAQRGFAALISQQEIREYNRTVPKSQRAAITDEESEAIRMFREQADALSAGPTGEELIRAQKRAAAKIRPGRMEQAPKRLQPELKKREAKVAQYEAEKKQELDAQEKTIRDFLARGRMTPREASDARAAVEVDRQKLATDVAIKRIENERWWQEQVAEPEYPVYFPDDSRFRPEPEVVLGERAEAVELATGVAQKTPTAIRTLADEVYADIMDQLTVAGEQQADVTIEMVGKAAREAAQRDLDADIAAITARERRFRITAEEATDERNATRKAHEYASERLEKATGFARRAREVRRENPNSPPISDFEIGIALQQIGPTRIASASRFTQELRGLFEYVEMPELITEMIGGKPVTREGAMKKTRVPKLGEDGKPIWMGILTKYAGDPKQTGSFMGQKMRARQSAPGAYERAERAEMSMERSMGQRARDKRIFARMVYEFNDYTDSQIDRGFTRENVSSTRSAPRDEATIKYFMREYGFVLPEWSKVPFPRRLKSTPTDVWATEYGLGAPKKRTKEEREAMAKARDRAAALARDMEAKIARRERKTSR
jgi:hypothetical protein